MNRFFVSDRRLSGPSRCRRVMRDLRPALPAASAQPRWEGGLQKRRVHHGDSSRNDDALFSQSRYPMREKERDRRGLNVTSTDSSRSLSK